MSLSVQSVSPLTRPSPQVTIFFALLSSAVLKYDPQTLRDSSNIDVLRTLLSIMTVTLPILEKVVEKLPCLHLTAQYAARLGQKASPKIRKETSKSTSTTDENLKA